MRTITNILLYLIGIVFCILLFILFKPNKTVEKQLEIEYDEETEQLWNEVLEEIKESDRQKYKKSV